MNTFETYSFGHMTDLYVEYVKRSEPFTMKADHYHDYYEIYYMLAGKRIYFIQDRSYSVEQGDLVFIPKHVLHKTLHSGEAAHERVILHFDDSFFQRLSIEHTQLLLSPFHQHTPVIRLSRQEQRLVDQLVKRMLAEIQQQPPGFELYPPYAVQDLLILTARYLQQHDPSPIHHDTPMHAKISEIVQYLNHHFAESIQLNTLAQQFFISPYYLSRKFKELTGFAFSDYLTLTRIKEAQRLLRDSDESITDIAAAAGFDNFSHFGKTFKKITRVSPRDYRKQR